MRCRPSLVRGRAAQVNPGGFTTPARRPSVPHRTAGCGKSSLRPLMAGSSPSLPDGSNPSAAIVQSASDVQCSRLLKTTLAWEVAVAAGHGFLRSFWVYAKCPVMLPPAKKAVMRFILAGSLLAGLNGRSVDLIARNGDARSRAGRPPSSDLAMVDAGAHRRMWRCELEVGGHRRRPGAIVGNGDAAARRARPGRLGIVGCGDARARRKKTASGCPRRQVCMRFREEETAPAIREENRAA